VVHSRDAQDGTTHLGGNHSRARPTMTAAQIRAARAALGLTQAQLAARLLTSVRTVKRWEAGETAIGEQRAARLRRAADLSGRQRAPSCTAEDA
jgi:DNA-binding transcriptional regulator YiaG